LEQNFSIENRWNNKALFGLLWPLMVEQLLVVAMGAADTVMVSSVGEHAVSGVNIIDNINNLLIIAFAAMSAGGTVVVSQYIGRRDHANSKTAAKQLIYLATFISLCMMTVALFLRRPIISLFYGNIADDVMDAAMVYFFFTALSFPFLAIYSSCSALFRATGNSKAPMRISLFVNFLSVGGNAIFIYVMGIGVMGAALATLISRIIAAGIASIMLYRNSASPVTLAGLFKVRIVTPIIKNICNVGIPGATESSMFMVGRLLTQRIFVGFGTVAMAANAITGAINSLAFQTGSAFSMTLVVVVGQCIGAGDYAAAKRFVKKIIRLAYIFLVGMSGLTFIFAEQLIGLFQLSPEAHVLAKTFLTTHCISMALGWALSFALPNALRAAGDARYVMMVSILSMWLVRVLGAYFFVFVLEMGPLGVWLAMGADFASRGISFLIRWLQGKWQTKSVIKY